MYILRLASTPVWDDIVDELVNEKMKIISRKKQLSARSPPHNFF